MAGDIERGRAWNAIGRGEHGALVKRQADNPATVDVDFVPAAAAIVPDGCVDRLFETCPRFPSNDSRLSS